MACKRAAITESLTESQLDDAGRRRWADSVTITTPDISYPFRLAICLLPLVK